MKSIQLMLLGFLACFFGPISFGLVENTSIGGGTSDGNDANGSPVPLADNNVSAEEVVDPLPPDENKPQEAEDVRPIGCGASEPTETDNGDIKGTDSSDQ